MRFGEPRAVLLAVSMYLQWSADWFQLRSVVVYGWFPMGNLLFSRLFFWSAMCYCLVGLLMVLCRYLDVCMSQPIHFVVASCNHLVGIMFLSCELSGGSLFGVLLVVGGAMLVGVRFLVVVCRLSVDNLQMFRSTSNASYWFPSSFPLCVLRVSADRIARHLLIDS